MQSVCTSTSRACTQQRKVWHCRKYQIKLMSRNKSATRTAHPLSLSCGHFGTRFWISTEVTSKCGIWDTIFNFSSFNSRKMVSGLSSNNLSKKTTLRTVSSTLPLRPVHKTAQIGKPTAQCSAIHTATRRGSRGHTVGAVNREACSWRHVFVPEDWESEKSPTESTQ